MIRLLFNLNSLLLYIINYNKFYVTLNKLTFKFNLPPSVIMKIKTNFMFEDINNHFKNQLH